MVPVTVPSVVVSGQVWPLPMLGPPVMNLSFVLEQQLQPRVVVVVVEVDVVVVVVGLVVVVVVDVVVVVGRVVVVDDVVVVVG